MALRGSRILVQISELTTCLRLVLSGCFVVDCYNAFQINDCDVICVVETKMIT